MTGFFLFCFGVFFLQQEGSENEEEEREEEEEENTDYLTDSNKENETDEENNVSNGKCLCINLDLIHFVGLKICAFADVDLLPVCAGGDHPWRRAEARGMR